MPRTGRPREFDLGEAVQHAMRLFWQHGYEATSLAQLKAAMGDISPASFYAAFDSKEALFRRVVDAYLATHGQVLAPLFNSKYPPRQAIEQALRGSARMQTDAGHPPGCLVVLSTTTCAPENSHVQQRLLTERQRNRAGIRACVDRAIACGELRTDSDAAALTAVFDTFLIGISTQARDGVPRSTLQAGITALLGVWDAHAPRHRPKRDRVSLPDNANAGRPLRPDADRDATMPTVGSSEAAQECPSERECAAGRLTWPCRRMQPPKTRGEAGERRQRLTSSARQQPRCRSGAVLSLTSMIHSLLTSVACNYIVCDTDT